MKKVMPKNVGEIQQEVNSWIDYWWFMYHDKVKRYSVVHSELKAAQLAFEEVLAAMDAYNSGKPIQEYQAA